MHLKLRDFNAMLNRVMANYIMQKCTKLSPISTELVLLSTKYSWDKNGFEVIRNAVDRDRNGYTIPLYQLLIGDGYLIIIFIK